MKAIILAAGKGKRFGEITDSLPKPLIKIGVLSLIERNIKLLKSCDFTDIIINVSHLSELIIDKLGNGENFGVNITYSIEKPEPLETGGGIHNALNFIDENQFIVLNSDIYTDFNLKNLCLQGNDLASLVMIKNPSHNLAGDFSLENGRITLNKINMMTYSGIAILNKKIFEGEKIRKYKLVDVLSKYIKMEKVSGLKHNGFWYDVGDIEKLKIVEKLFI